MKLLHLSDLHIGKSLNGYQLIDDQSYILNEIIRYVKEKQPNAVIIAGDIYDKTSPAAEAVALFDSFITRLSELAENIFIISGNHDSAERIAFGSSLMRRSKVYFSPVYTGSIEPVTVSDEFGEIDFWLIPYLRPSAVRRFFPDEDTSDSNAAFKTAVSHLDTDEKRRNIMIAHQAVIGAEPDGSELIPVGGLDFIGADAFRKFDYTALGHIHRAQSITPKIRYCGTPLKYSLSEASSVKSLSFITIGEKNSPVSVEEIPLSPLHDMKKIKGTFDEIISPSFPADREDYTYITLTDENEVVDALGRLREIYPRIMGIRYDNSRTRISAAPSAARQSSPIEAFESFYAEYGGTELSKEQSEYLKNIISEIWDE